MVSKRYQSSLGLVEAAVLVALAQQLWHLRNIRAAPACEGAPQYGRRARGGYSPCTLTARAGAHRAALGPGRARSCSRQRCARRGVSPALNLPQVNAAGNAPTVEVEELYLDAMFAVPSVNVSPPKSLQVPYQAVSVYTRTLTPANNFTETFTSIPASVGAIVIGLRDATHGIANNRELYERGALGTAGATQGIKTLSLALGSLQLPIPAYQLNFSKHQFGRLFADWLSFTGGSASNGVGGDSMTEFAKSPLAAFRVLQEPGAYASTAIVRLETAGANTDANTEMVLWCIHQKVFEAFWSDGESFPSRVVVDDVLN